MKCRKWMYMTMMLFALLTISAIAQDNQNPGPMHHHYKFIDLGTFGGPNTNFFTQGEGAQFLNNRGVVTDDRGIVGFGHQRWS